MFPTTPTVDLSDRDNKETLLVKEEETNDAEVFGEVVMEVAFFSLFFTALFILVLHVKRY